jgi:hypothetical protein
MGETSITSGGSPVVGCPSGSGSDDWRGSGSALVPGGVARPVNHVAFADVRRRPLPAVAQRGRPGVDLERHQVLPARIQRELPRIACSYIPADGAALRLRRERRAHRSASTARARGGGFGDVQAASAAKAARAMRMARS